MGEDRRRFRIHETHRMHALEGVALASVGQRILGYVIDIAIALILWVPLEFVWRRYLLHQQHIDLTWNFHEAGNLVVMLLYWATWNYFGNGQTPGKFVARTRAVSLTSERLGLWQSIERAVGYGAAILEGGLGFVQVLWDKNRMCAQDCLAETIVVDIRQHKSRATAPDAARTNGKSDPAPTD